MLILMIPTVTHGMLEKKEPRTESRTTSRKLPYANHKIIVNKHIQGKRPGPLIRKYTVRLGAGVQKKLMQYSATNQFHLEVYHETVTPLFFVITVLRDRDVISFATMTSKGNFTKYLPGIIG